MIQFGQCETMPHLQNKAGQRHYKVAAKDLPALEFTARTIDSVAELEALVEPWTRLVRMSVRPNPFFDPDFLIPAFKHLGDGAVSVLVVEAPQRVWPTGPKILCALLPIVKRRFYSLPLSCYEIWKHDQCFDCTPLIRSDCGAEVLKFTLDYLREHASLISLNTVASEGDFARLLVDYRFQSATTVFHRDAFSRACFYPSVDAETYINTEVSKNTRKGVLRLQRKLRDVGDLKISTSHPTDEPRAWIDDFLSLESSGWKGTDHSSLASLNSTRHFFAEMAERTWASGKMSILKVQFNGQPIAMMCDIQQGDYGVAFKIAFDERYADYSPGLIAVLNNLYRLHEIEPRMFDSCADPNHSMINRVWSGRTLYQSLVLASGGPFARVATAAMPLLQLVAKFRKG